MSDLTGKRREFCFTFRGFGVHLTNETNYLLELNTSRVFFNKDDDG